MTPGNTSCGGGGGGGGGSSSSTTTSNTTKKPATNNRMFGYDYYQGRQLHDDYKDSRQIESEVTKQKSNDVENYREYEVATNTKRSKQSRHKHHK